MTAEGRLLDCRSEVIVNLEVAVKVLKLPCIPVDRMLPDVYVILGTDALRYFDCSFIRGEFFICAAADVSDSFERIKIQKNNFEVKFDGNKWVAKWVWKREPILKNRYGNQ